MLKEEFLTELNKGISHLPKEEINERIEFYSEMIDDLIEEGLSEEDAVARIGSVDEIISKIVADAPKSNAKKEKDFTKKRPRAWEIVLIILGSPIWFSLIIAAFAVIFSLYVSLWSVIVSLWAVFASLIASFLGCIILGIVNLVIGSSISGIAYIGLGFAAAGLSIILFFGCNALTRSLARLTSKTFSGIIKCVIRKEER